MSQSFLENWPAHSVNYYEKPDYSKVFPDGSLSPLAQICRPPFGIIILPLYSQTDILHSILVFTGLKMSK
jgi:hypothetical protein